MSDEFDDAVDALPAAAAKSSRRRARAARLVVRLYGSANLALRTRVLAALIRPLSPLGLAAIGAGAFTVLFSPSGGISVAVADVARFSKEQIADLVRFVEQVSPEALAQVATLVADHPLQSGTFTASVALLLALELGGASARRARRLRSNARRAPQAGA